ncbi:MAG TPA: YraN family protein [Anaerovoracaceae bacterium]|nr:YraN family protein [Anaerovoracaceae bacterium]
MNNTRLGKMGEAKAILYLEREGYMIVSQNYKCKFGELDIIAMEGETLVAIEVKTRRTLTFGMPCESITEKKKRHISRAFTHFAKYNQINMDMRIDVIEMLLLDGNVYINHIKNAI